MYTFLSFLFFLLNLIDHWGETYSLNSFVQELEAWVPVLSQPLWFQDWHSFFFLSHVILDPSLNIWASIALICKMKACCGSFQL